MGMLSSGSNVPNVPVSSVNNSVAETEKTATDSADKEVKTYLSEKRGKIGTVNTSWQGLLQEGSKQPKRKTLLGE